jgi:hypothetical protein
MGNAYLVTRIKDLPSPLFESWKSARSLWKCYHLTRQCLPGLVEQQKQALFCLQTSLDGLNVQDYWQRAETKFE